MNNPNPTPKVITVPCPKCGRTIVVNCNYTHGQSLESETCRGCGHVVQVEYSNDSFGFRVINVR